MGQSLIALTIFLGTYALIISEKLHRAIAALLGGTLLIILGIVSQEKAIHHIDWNTLGLLIGMMIIVGITKKTGVFQYLAVKAVKWAKGEPVYILIALATVTAFLSAFLDNVTTVLLIVPVTFTITDRLGINPIPFLISQVLASNIGGTATLIGDPPNIMIGSQTHLDFLDFLKNLTPVVAIIHIATMFLFYLIYRKDFNVSAELKKKLLDLNEIDEIKDFALLKKSLFVLGLVILGFILHGALGLESATIALFGAALLLTISRDEPEEVLLTVEWPSIFFFLGLFIVVGGLVETGVIDRVARWSLEATKGNFTLTGMLILWLSAIASAFVDNIPFVATMIPLIQKMGALAGMTPQALEPLWWALSLGACLGGNGTIIGASANVIVAGLAEKNGYPISFMGFMKIAFPLMLVSIVISMIYLLLFYF
ncbi:ArsB/NhaD family transporter [Carboxydothermus ferrireducens]|uniref:Na+/H+ antiporter NhaD/arsenite permease-like protein n=1 Tax=Carboxydothermus ferrireducens DSM 11255 TaxID=1119529 RepID=A0ABX2RC15_9THEO|nr:ArsB/NhaD family transporter [Carboxydothermus ferrireducens]NYE58731.1 Na+/H+ antiporter NhaD/arsenite permease-like protein [Carboxydothermus ferrireducens DSM 11255]